MPPKPIISITDSAADRVKHLLTKRDKPSIGIRVGVKTGGCSGLTYTFEYAETKEQGDEMISDKGVNIFIEPKEVMYIIGTTLDFVDEKVSSGFVFINPNEKGGCGCGKSFYT